MFRSIIIRRVGSTLNGHHHILNRVDGQITVGHMESHNEFGISIGEVIHRQAHHRHTHIGSAYR